MTIEEILNEIKEKQVDCYGAFNDCEKYDNCDDCFQDSFSQSVKEVLKDKVPAVKLKKFLSEFRERANSYCEFARIEWCKNYTSCIDCLYNTGLNELKKFLQEVLPDEN